MDTFCDAHSMAGSARSAEADGVQATAERSVL
jgi:hypothetical protein